MTIGEVFTQSVLHAGLMMLAAPVASHAQAAGAGKWTDRRFMAG